MISSIVSIGCIRSLPVLREAFVTDGLRCGIGCLVSIRNVRTRRRQFLPMFTEQLEKPRRRQRIDILDETQIDGDFEKVETGVNTLDTEELEQYKRKILAERMFIKRKILEKKYFRQPSEPNILSWNTKEYMRLLNRRDPDEWTVDRLANSFPLSRESVIRILKSSYRPKTDAEMFKHDKRARKNFLAIKDSLGDKQIAAYDLVMNKMQNESRSLLAASDKGRDRSLETVDKMGVFEAIVQNIPVKHGSSVRVQEPIDLQFFKKKKV